MALSKNVVSITIFVVILICSEVHTKKVKVINKLPSYFPVCFRNDPALNKCLINATNQVRPHLVKGVPELRIPPFEPFIIPEINLDLGTKSLNYTSTMKDIVVHGLTKYEFTRFDFDVPNLQFDCEFDMPGLQIEGDYSVAGRFLITPIEGKGKFTASFDFAKGYLYQKNKESIRDGKIYLAPVFTNGTFDVTGPKGHVEGLFNGNKEIDEIVNKVVSDNVDELFAEFKPALERVIVKIAEDILLKTIVGNIPWDDLYPIKKNNYLEESAFHNF